MDFSKEFGTGTKIDWNKVLYNSFYRSYEIYEQRYAKEIAGIPGFDHDDARPFVESKENNDPLAEYNNRISEQEIDGRITIRYSFAANSGSEGELYHRKLLLFVCG